MRVKLLCLIAWSSCLNPAGVRAAETFESVWYQGFQEQISVPAIQDAGPVLPKSKFPFSLLLTKELQSPNFYWKTGVRFKVGDRVGYLIATKDRTKGEDDGFCLGFYFDGEAEPHWVVVSVFSRSITLFDKAYKVEIPLPGVFVIKYIQGWLVQRDEWKKNPDRIPVRITDKEGQDILIEDAKGEFHPRGITVGEIAVKTQSNAPKVSLDGTEYQLTYSGEVRIVQEKDETGADEERVRLLPNRYVLAITKYEKYFYDHDKSSYHFGWASFSGEEIAAGDACVQYWSKIASGKNFRRDFPYVVCVNPAHQAEIYAIPDDVKARLILSQKNRR